MTIKSDLNRIDRMSDDDIDYSDIPPLTDDQLSAMKPLREVFPELAHQKKILSIELEADTILWFKQRAERTIAGSYQAMINKALRKYIEIHSIMEN